MQNKKQFLDYVLSYLESHGPIRSRAMFGGYGIYFGDVMFGLIAENILYFRVDDQNRLDYLAHDSKPFVYSAGPKTVSLPYFELPEEILNNSEELDLWIKKSVDAAKRNKAASSKKPGATKKVSKK